MSKLNNKKGFTLIETITALSVFVLAFGAICGFIYYIYRVHSFTFEQARAIDEARKGISIMVKEIREARDGEGGIYAIEKANDQEFIFYSDIDKDEAAERIRYFLEDSNFKKGVTNPEGSPAQYKAENETVSILSAYVRNNESPVFTYYNGDWPEDSETNPLPTPSRLKETKLMRVYLKININPNRAPQDFELISASQLRNLKTNL